MSIWSHIHGVIEVETFGRTSAEAMYFAQTVVDHLPRIDGSEGPVEFYLNLKRGHNCSSSADENMVQSNLYNEYYFKTFEHQSCVLITLQGDLRDCTFVEALKMTYNALNRLSKHLIVRGCSVTVASGIQEYMFSNPSWMLWRDDTTDWPNNLIRRPWDEDKEEDENANID